MTVIVRNWCYLISVLRKKSNETESIYSLYSKPIHTLAYSLTQFLRFIFIYSFEVHFFCFANLVFFFSCLLKPVVASFPTKMMPEQFKNFNWVYLVSVLIHAFNKSWNTHHTERVKRSIKQYNLVSVSTKNAIIKYHIINIIIFLPVDWNSSCLPFTSFVLLFVALTKSNFTQCSILRDTMTELKEKWSTNTYSE